MVEEFDFVIRGKVEAVSRMSAANFLESVFDGAPVRFVRVDVDNLSCFFPARSEK